MNEEMTQIVLNRVNEMKQDKNIMELLLKKCETSEKAHEMLLKMAVATLIIPVEKRNTENCKIKN